ncbi:hypothetical protein [Mycobacterium sp. NPDC006124]|uniref:hypothetical protein n=1 Tax=Mycobacterium sp. NPDC006124 TaxID=3156729 RepID=UPI00339E9FB6
MHTLVLDRHHPEQPPADVAKTWLTAFRSAFDFGAMTCPASQLADPSLAAWIGARGVCVDVESAADLDTALSVGVAPARIVLHGSDSDDALLRRDVEVGIGHCVIGSVLQAANLATVARRRIPVTLGVTEDGTGPEAAVLSSGRLQPVGMHMRVDDIPGLGPATSLVIAKMGDVRRRRGLLLTRVTLADVDLRGATPRLMALAAAAIEDAVDESCARHRFPRPTVVLSPPTTDRTHGRFAA